VAPLKIKGRGTGLTQFPTAGLLIVDNDARAYLGLNEAKDFLTIRIRAGELLLRESASHRVAAFRAHNVLHQAATAYGIASWLPASHKWILPGVSPSGRHGAHPPVRFEG
jgi:hypothetical protein